MIRNNKLLFLSWATYVTAYMCRVNMSVVLVKLEDAFAVSSGLLGIIGSLFFCTYAIGQLINGVMGDRVSPYKMLLTALTGTLALNFIIGVSSNLYLILACWAMNGYFQSMFWGPLMRMLSAAYPKQEHLRISTVMSTSMVIGYMLVWVVLSGVFSKWDWNVFFLIPAIISICPLLLWIMVTRASQNSVSEKSPPSLRKTIGVIKASRLAPIILICVCMGLIKESVSLWAPTIMIKIFGFEPHNSYIFLFIIPAFNFAGILFVKNLAFRITQRVGRIFIFLFGGMCVGGVGLLVFGEVSGLLGLAALALISAMAFGANGILLSFIPLSFAKQNIVSTLVGIFDFCVYIGAAVSSFALGNILDNLPWRFIPALWLLVAVAAICFSAVYDCRTRTGVQS